MDGERFDRLARSLITGVSRRSLLAGLFGGAVATVASTQLLEAKRGGKGKGRGKGKGKGKGKGGNGNGNGGGGDNDEKRTICHCPPGNPDNCHTIRVGKKAAQSHLRNHSEDHDGPCDDDGQEQCLPVTDTEGDVEEGSNGEFILTTEDNEAFGNLIFEVPEDTTFGDLEGLESTFSFATGTCTAGTPRFVVFMESGRCPYAAFPPGGDCEDGEGQTGNLIGNNTAFVWNDDLCGGSGLGTNTYDEVLALYEGEEIARIVLVVDESGGEQTVTVEPCINLDRG